jgi:hypothetical protein
VAVTRDTYYSPLATFLRDEGDGTVSLQAHPFCERFGSVVFGELPDHPAGQTLYFMKML